MSRWFLASTLCVCVFVCVCVCVFLSHSYHKPKAGLLLSAHISNISIFYQTGCSSRPVVSPLRQSVQFARRAFPRRAYSAVKVACHRPCVAPTLIRLAQPAASPTVPHDMSIWGEEPCALSAPHISQIATSLSCSFHWPGWQLAAPWLSCSPLLWLITS